MSEEGYEKWAAFVAQLTVEGDAPRSEHECGEESSHATVVILPCSPYPTWADYDYADRKWKESDLVEPDPQKYLPCRRCRCGKSRGHVDGCRVLWQRKLI